MRVDKTSYQDAAERVLAWARDRQSRYVCVASVNNVMEAYDSREFRRIMNQADLVTPDGMPLVWGLRMLGAREATRVYGPDLTPVVLGAAERAGVPVGFYGASPGTLERLFAVVRRRYPALEIAYAFAPPFRPLAPAEDAAVVGRIRSSGARILFVGLSTPKQERWMAAHRGRIPAVMLGVGAAFDFLAGAKRQAPLWMQDSRLGMALPPGVRTAPARAALSEAQPTLRGLVRPPVARTTVRGLSNRSMGTTIEACYGRREAAAVAATRTASPLATGISVLAADALAVTASCWLAVQLWSFVNRAVVADAYLRLWPAAIVFLAAYAMLGLYPGVGLSPVEELRRLVLGTTLVCLVASASIVLTRETGFSRGVLVAGWALCVILVPITRAAVRHFCASRPWWGVPVLVLGAGETGQEVRRQPASATRFRAEAGGFSG